MFGFVRPAGGSERPVSEFSPLLKPAYGWKRADPKRKRSKRAVTLSTRGDPRVEPLVAALLPAASLLLPPLWPPDHAVGRPLVISPPVTSQIPLLPSSHGQIASHVTNISRSRVASSPLERVSMVGSPSVLPLTDFASDRSLWHLATMTSSMVARSHPSPTAS